MPNLNTLEFLSGVLCGLVLAGMSHFVPAYLEGSVVFITFSLTTIFAAGAIYEMLMGE